MCQLEEKTGLQSSDTKMHNKGRPNGNKKGKLADDQAGFVGVLGCRLCWENIDFWIYYIVL